MERVNISRPTEVILNGKIVELLPDVYEFEGEAFCKENDFIKCNRCLDWFIEGNAVTHYHPKSNKGPNFSYCDHCFEYRYKEKFNS